jgi:hypothetical protein
MHSNLHYVDVSDQYHATVFLSRIRVWVDPRTELDGVTKESLNLVVKLIALLANQPRLVYRRVIKINLNLDRIWRCRS